MEEVNILKETQNEKGRSFWEKKFLEYDAHYAGMNYKEFCKAQSLNYGCLKYWRRRLNHQKVSLEAKKRFTGGEKKVSFVPVKITLPHMSEKSQGIELYYGKAYRFVLPLDIGKVTLVSLFKALEESDVNAAIRD